MFTQDELLELITAAIHEAQRIRGEKVMAEEWRRVILDKRYMVLGTSLEKLTQELRSLKSAPAKIEDVEVA